MTLSSALTLFLTMVLLALIPGPGVLVVAGRAASAGLRHGFSVTVGIVAGDFIFIILALLGLAALADVMGSFFFVVKYLGAAYLLWLGFSIALSKPGAADIRQVQAPSHLASFIAGLVTTLSNPKAILFYVSIFPSLLDLSQIDLAETAVIFAITTLAVGGVMLAYAWLSHKARSSFRDSSGNPLLRYGSGAMLVGSGLFVAARG